MSYKWIFTINNKVDGTLERYKAKMVAKGYIKTYKLITKSYCLTAKMNTIRIL